MNMARAFITAIVVATTLTLAACQQSDQPSVITHKLVVTGNQNSIPLFPDEQTYLNVSREKQEGGVTGVVGQVNKSLNAKEIDDQTAVNIVSADDNGAMVEIVAGPMKGQTGFVAKQNVN
jgi:hypothetical protein